MAKKRYLLAALTVIFALAFNVLAAAQTRDPLPSWNDGNAKQSIIGFVARATTEGSPDFVLPAQRIATFDNDGTLWVEHPMYTQLAFALDRVRALAPRHPEWKATEPFKAVLDNDLKTLAASGEKGLLELVMATHAGMGTTEFEAIVKDWFATARHPRFKRPYTELTYKPMVELLAYSARERFQDLYRVRRWRRVHAPDDGGSLRHSPGAGHRFEHQDRIHGQGR